MLNRQDYINIALECGELVWRRGLLVKGKGLCHGVSGNAYLFLWLFRVTSDQKHLWRAVQFANFSWSDEAAAMWKQSNTFVSKKKKEKIFFFFISKK